MPGLRVGRFGSGSANTLLDLETISDVSINGDKISIDGDLVEDTPAALLGRLQQIGGMLGPDEQCVPVLWDAAHEFMEGYYRVTGANANLPRSVDLTTAPFAIELERVQGFKAPLFESLIQGGPREQVASTPAAPLAWSALPSTVKGYEIGVDLTPTFTDRATEDGPVTVFTNPANTLYNARAEYLLEPAHFYRGAARLDIDGVTMIGRQVPNKPSAWTMSNGLCRVVATATGFTVSTWSGTAWTRPLTVTFRRRTSTSNTAGNTLSAPHTMTVIRNSPEEVVLRLYMDASSATAGARFAVRADISLRRGSRVVPIRMEARGTYDWGIAVAGYGTAAVTGDFRMQASGGNIILRDRYSSGQVTSGVAYAMSLSGTGGRPFVGGVGHYSTTAAAGHIDHPESIAAQWAAQQREKTVAVAR